MAIKKHVQHIRSSVADSVPETNQLGYGEIAINYNTNNERLFIKNHSDEIVPFYSGKVIEENERVTSAALSDLDARINDIEENNVNTENMENIVYSELKAKRDGGELVPGKYYRITDYITATAQENTRSAGHQFDVVVLALDKRTLSENAHAISHEGDTYFNNCKLNSWKIKYCMDNDTTMFAWADTSNGKGVIYYMKDEYDNECPYDFKNIQFKRIAINQIASSDLSEATLRLIKATFLHDNNSDRHFGSSNFLGKTYPKTPTMTFGYNNNEYEWYYTFNGRLSENGYDVSYGYDLTVHKFRLEDDCIASLEEGDASNTQDKCYGNKINVCTSEKIGDGLYYKGRRVLNDIVFSSSMSYCYYDTMMEQWQYKTSVCTGNIFAEGCHSNTFGGDCISNKFGQGVNSCLFGDAIKDNVFGGETSNNMFGCNIYGNTFGDGASHNVFGGETSNNMFGCNMYGNTFGDGVSHNVFGNENWYNVFGDSIQGNATGNDILSIVFGNTIVNNVFSNGIKDITYTDNNGVKRDGFRCNIIEPGVIDVVLKRSLSSDLQNVTIAQGIGYSGTETQREIICDTENSAFKVTYQPTQSQTILI